MVCELQPGMRSSGGCSSLRAQLQDFILTYSPTTLINPDAKMQPLENKEGANSVSLEISKGCEIV